MQASCYFHSEQFCLLLSFRSLLKNKKKETKQFYQVITFFFFSFPITIIVVCNANFLEATMI